MSTIDIIHTVSFKFIDADTFENLTKHWNFNGFGPIEMPQVVPNSAGEFAEWVWESRPDIFEDIFHSGIFKQALQGLALNWWEAHGKDYAQLVDLGLPIWFGAAVSFRLVNTPWMYPKPKNPKDERARLHVQFN